QTRTVRRPCPNRGDRAPTEGFPEARGESAPMKLFFLTLRNWAETDEPGDAELSNIVLPWTPDETLRRIEDIVRTLPRWRIEKADAATGEIHLTRRTRLFRFVDD